MGRNGGTLDPPDDLLAILGNMRVAVFRTAADSRLLSLNAGGAALLGASDPEELLGRPFADFYVDPEERAEARRLLMEHGQVIGFRFRARRLDGTILWIETNVRARRDEQGQFEGVEGFAREVGELVSAEAEVRQLNQFLQVVIEGVDMLLVALDVDARVRIWNTAAEAITGYSSKEVLGGHEVWEWLYPDPEYRQRMVEEPRRAVFARGHVELESVIRAKSGEARTILWNASRLTDSQGTPIGGLAIGRDVTAERALQRRLHEQEEQTRAELERQVRDRTAELELANLALQRLDQMKARFLANISHELRTPLVSGLGYVNLVLEGGMGAISARVRKGLGISRQNLQRLTGLIDDLLAFTHDGASAERPIQRTTFELDGLIKECLLDLQGHLRPGVRLSTSLGESPLKVSADREKIRRVLLNLLSNAEKFTGDDATIEVRARPLAPGQVEVEVRDNGIGIPEAERELVFERLGRSSRTDPSVHRGTGLGLHLVREILRAHGCSVRAEGRGDGTGTTIVFTLPMALPTDEAR